VVKLDDLDDVVMLDKALKNEYSSKIKRYIESLIRHEELSKITNKKRYKDSKRLIYEADFSPLTCEKNIIRQILKEKADLFIKDMEEITMLEKMCSELPTIQEIRGLSTIDRVHIELLAHVIFKYVTLDEDVFDSSKGGIDIHFDIFTQQDVKKLKNTIKAILYNLIGSEGEFFYGIKFRKSNLSDIDILNFRLKLFKHDDIENQRIAFTDYSAVCLYNSDSEYVIYNKFVTEQTKIQIAMEDLVIRSNIFKCMNKSHDIKTFQH
jgi:hypothetical protein